jgi:hypothetical protein
MKVLARSKGRIHIDAWREVAVVDNFSIEIIKAAVNNATDNLFFINLVAIRKMSLKNTTIKS